MSDEIAEFLRRAAQRRAEQMQNQMEQQRRASQQFQPQPVVRQLQPIVDAEIIDDDEPIQLSSARSSIGGRSLDNPEFARRADRLGDATEQADERIGAHMHQAFDHRLGNLGAGTESIMAAVTPEVDDEMKARVVVKHPLLAMLRQPESVRNAIIVSELLNRPTDHW